MQVDVPASTWQTLTKGIITVESSSNNALLISKVLLPSEKNSELRQFNAVLGEGGYSGLSHIIY